MIQLRNTLDSNCQVSPAEIAFGHHLKDSFEFLKNLDNFSNLAECPVWREAWKQKEKALLTRFVINEEVINHNARKF